MISNDITRIDNASILFYNELSVVLLSKGTLSREYERTDRHKVFQLLYRKITQLISVADEVIKRQGERRQRKRDLWEKKMKGARERKKSVT